MHSTPIYQSVQIADVSVKSANHTGHVLYFSTGADNYTFVDIATTTGNVAGYYIGDNAAVASVIDNAKRLNQKITITTEDTTGRIIYVR